VERDDRSPVASFYATTALSVGAVVELSESAAHHARVKRLSVGDVLRLTDGRGRSAIGTLSSIDKRRATVDVESSVRVAPPPEIHVRVPVGDRERMLLLAEKATELGITSWQAVRFRRSMSVSPRGEGEIFGAKIEARMISALEQSGGAWLPWRVADTAIEAIATPGEARRILLDRDGVALLTLAAPAPIVLLFGPEGGVEPDERAMLEANGWQRATLGGSTLRFETAGIAAIAVTRAAQPAAP
jgi:16S rRNA (uracil1498-N3)-methyltransferase